MKFQKEKFPKEWSDLYKKAYFINHYYSNYFDEDDSKLPPFSWYLSLIKENELAIGEYISIIMIAVFVENRKITDEEKINFAKKYNIKN